MCGTKNPHKALLGCDASQPRPRWQASGGSPPRCGLDEIGPRQGEEGDFWGRGPKSLHMSIGDFVKSPISFFLRPPFGAAS